MIHARNDGIAGLGRRGVFYIEVMRGTAGHWFSLQIVIQLFRVCVLT